MEKEKKSKKKLFIIIGIVVVVLLLLVMLLSSGDDSSEEYDSSYDETTEESSDYEDAETSSDYDGSGEESETSDNVSGSIDFTSEADFPLGTCGELDGTIVVMSIAADDATTSWNFDDAQDQQTLADISGRFAIGLDWIAQQGKKYGKNINFIYNWDEDNELFYTAQLSEDYSTMNGNYRQDTKTFIDENLSSYAANLVKKYNADGIMFVYYLNLPVDTDFICFAENFIGTDLGMDYPYDVLCVDKWVYGAEQGPATYAHEVLHLFGAPDLYEVDTDGSNYGMTEEFVSYCQENHLNEIMCTTYDPYNNVIPTDKVTNELTDLTAYYIGWIDSNEECAEFGVLTSTH